MNMQPKKTNYVNHRFLFVFVGFGFTQIVFFLLLISPVVGYLVPSESSVVWRGDALCMGTVDTSLWGIWKGIRCEGLRAQPTLFVLHSGFHFPAPTYTRTVWRTAWLHLGKGVWGQVLARSCTGGANHWTFSPPCWPALPLYCTVLKWTEMSTQLLCLPDASVINNPGRMPMFMPTEAATWSLYMSRQFDYLHIIRLHLCLSVQSFQETCGPYHLYQRGKTNIGSLAFLICMT